ncbi:type II toxin-antitoxin system HicB family antitoxin [Cupriavidus sp. KB_39]|uniref:type II toxin-antitoxin system HicB family antitoxin n=1 Tax=Cupriavidus sp. KB_39 TaxID=3233036 RepID=UPI003F901A47
MNNMLEYKNYYGSVEMSLEDRCLVGKIEFIDDLIMFDGATVGEIEAAFREAVDAYVAFCAEHGKEPCGTYKGSFNVRVGPDLHRKAVVAARKNHQTLNEYVKCAIEHVLYEDPRAHEKPVHHYHVVPAERPRIEFRQSLSFELDVDAPMIAEVTNSSMRYGH